MAYPSVAPKLCSSISAMPAALPCYTSPPTFPPMTSFNSTSSGPIYLYPGFIAVFVLASLCALLGAIYAYLYFNHIKPNHRRPRTFSNRPSTSEDGKAHPFISTHIFFFKNYQLPNSGEFRK
ncbi:hypothetical protein CAPTEDRAFT_191801 [Capitella teleta]|uniref:Uncharacterized protein n=1 Tax=Capitella teleta TaxID=283909 RepID=R7TSF8_CAPTE|nr:hypothetical protein CAPTEDRAFT_191801 [Capitella teleta]|eukprot:ELT93965.1 hypothetical protein CAPTEDRAFT_191801 [Capitella teleta]